MPYIKQDERKYFNKLTDLMEDTRIESPGQLNYLITKLCHSYLKCNGLNYQHINDCVGALEGCKLEMYRQIVSPYENYKIQENGQIELDEKTWMGKSTGKP